MNIEKAKIIKAGVNRLLFDEATVEFLEGLCHFRKPVYQGDVNASLIAEGQRQVYLTLKTINELSPEQIVSLYN